MRRNVSNWTVVLLVLVVGAAVGGCGWTPRDEFQLCRSLTIKARPGSGTEVAYRFNAQETLAARRIGAEVAATNPVR